jgi:predicted flap endonuclease-1-like 5' DNA nuclease
MSTAANPWVYFIAGALVGWVVGWLMELLFFRNPKPVATPEQWDALNAQLTACKKELDAARSEQSSLNAQLAACRGDLDTARAAATVVVASEAVALRSAGPIEELPTEPDNLEILEGIGPKRAAKLRQAGVTNYARLAMLTPAWLNDIIKAPAWRRPSYEDWIAQARLAAAGDAAGLKALQDELFARQGDNLVLLYGVGPKTAAALRAAGLTSFAAVAKADPDRLRSIAHEVGLADADVNGWIEEAALRAEGKPVSRTRGARSETTPVSCPQDLSRITGIGPVLEAKLYAAGVGTFWEVANLEADELGRILEAEKMPNVALNAIRASARALAEQSKTVGITWDGTQPDDLEELEGIGEVYERRLMDGGICTFAALANATPAQLDAICTPPPNQQPDYASWIGQAAARTR